jgi:hypothetical protein
MLLAITFLFVGLPATAHPMIIDGQVIGTEDPNEIDLRRPTTCLAFRLRNQSNQRIPAEFSKKILNDLDNYKKYQTEASKEFDARTIIEHRINQQADELLLTDYNRRIGIPSVQMSSRGAEAVVPIIDKNSGLVADTVRNYTRSTDSDGNVVVY